jgi:hypothetical protein
MSSIERDHHNSAFAYCVYVLSRMVVFWFFIAFILRNNSRLTNLRRFSQAEFHVLRGPRPQDAGTPSLLVVLTSEFNPGPVKGLHQQSNLCQTKSPQTLSAAKFLSNYTVQLQCLQRAPGCRVTEKANISTLIVGQDRP